MLPLPLRWTGSRFIFIRIHSHPRKINSLPVAFILIKYNENKTSTSLEKLQRFENEVFLKSPLLPNLRYYWWFNNFRHNEHKHNKTRHHQAHLFINLQLYYDKEHKIYYKSVKVCMCNLRWEYLTYIYVWLDIPIHSTVLYPYCHFLTSSALNYWKRVRTRNALVLIIYSEVSGQCSHTIPWYIQC